MSNVEMMEAAVRANPSDETAVLAFTNALIESGLSAKLLLLVFNFFAPQLHCAAKRVLDKADASELLKSADDLEEFASGFWTVTDPEFIVVAQRQRLFHVVKRRVVFVGSNGMG